MASVLLWLCWPSPASRVPIYEDVDGPTGLQRVERQSGVAGFHAQPAAPIPLPLRGADLPMGSSGGTAVDHSGSVLFFFRGNRLLSDDELTEHLLAAGLREGLAAGDAEKIARDTLRGLYTSRGHFAYQVLDLRIHEGPPEVVEITLDEGELSRWGEIVCGAFEPDLEPALRRIVRSGDPVDLEYLDATKRDWTERFHQDGFLDFKMESTYMLLGGSSSVGLALSLFRGPRYRFGNVIAPADWPNARILMALRGRQYRGALLMERLEYAGLPRADIDLLHHLDDGIVDIVVGDADFRQDAMTREPATQRNSRKSLHSQVLAEAFANFYEEHLRRARDSAGHSHKP